MGNQGKLCPSAPCKEGAILLGIIQADGRVAYLGSRLKIDRQFVAIANQGRSPEKRFRFANTCIEDACCQWTGAGCGVAELVVEHTPSEIVKASLPACNIRSECRWYYERGARACAVCPLVITDARMEAVPEPAAL